MQNTQLLGCTTISFARDFQIVLRAISSDSGAKTGNDAQRHQFLLSLKHFLVIGNNEPTCDSVKLLILGSLVSSLSWGRKGFGRFQ